MWLAASSSRNSKPGGKFGRQLFANGNGEVDLLHGVVVPAAIAEHGAAVVVTAGQLLAELGLRRKFGR